MNDVAAITTAPGLIAGLMRTLLTQPNQRVSRRSLTKCVFVDPNTPLIDELVAAGLLHVDSDSDSLGISGQSAGLDQMLGMTETGRPHRLGMLLSWFLAQPTGGIPSGAAAIRKSMKHDAEAKNRKWDCSESELNGAVRWGVWFGLLRQIRIGACDGVVADPTIAVRRILTDLLPSGEPMSASMFRSELGRRCPVLDGGATRAIALDHFSLPWPENRLSSSLAFTLRRLRKEGWIELIYVNDAKPENMLNLGENDRITSIRRLERTSSA